MLGANPHPHALELAKVQALNRRAQELGMSVQALNIVVNFTTGRRQRARRSPGALQRIAATASRGCNVRAKNTLYMNYLPMARKAGATILTQNKVEWLEKLAGGRLAHSRAPRT